MPVQVLHKQVRDEMMSSIRYHRKQLAKTRNPACNIPLNWVKPKRLKEGTGENAICTPLVVTGTPEELDSGFAAELSRYAGSLTSLGSNLSTIEAAHSAAIKAVEHEKKKDLDRKRGKSSGSRPTTGATEPNPGPAIKDGKPVFGTKNASGNAEPVTLFDVQEVIAGQRGGGCINTGTCLRPTRNACENSPPIGRQPSARAEASGPGLGDSPLSYPD